MVSNIAEAVRNDRIAVVPTYIDAGSGPGKIKIYTVSFGLLLATLVYGDPSHGSPAAGSVTANPITSDPSAADTGVAKVFRITDSDDNVVLEGTAGIIGTDLILSTDVITQTDSVAITSAIFTDPAG